MCLIKGLNILTLQKILPSVLKKRNYNKSCSHQEYTTVCFPIPMPMPDFFFIFFQSDRYKMAHSALICSSLILSEAKGVFHIYWPFIISLVRIVS